MLLKYVRYSLFFIIFFLAIMQTFLTFSGVKATAIGHWLQSQSVEYVGGDHHLKKGSLHKKSLQTSGDEIAVFREYPTRKVVATGYTAGYESTGKTETHPAYGITYSGVNVKRDTYSTIAADPAVFPIGTILYIPDYGYGVVADTGSAIKENKIDLYFETVEDVYNEWGKKEVDVFIMKKGNGTLTEEELLQLNANIAEE